MKVVKGTNRRYPYRSLIPTALLLGILLPFVFIRSAFLALEAGATLCPSISKFIPPLFNSHLCDFEFGYNLDLI